ncbi:membrane-bound acid phosphatase [Trypanosoma cruzi cruzi]|uniref:Putative membrane-bound acid phosphatase n=1 Tax=Trypanosoma cruzi TaxID=5693 RepID=A0A2V2VZB2_TRYCR|nr:membrane-bound acid phosphatase [Trypanosoma cruzi cruzi]PWU83383.1 putative membrane-bound acid phosphatase [Trypanosoma cruzi]PBJ72343.1 membrane-bound acid phosphatase [Trypanosoma cruzi cruzi]PBJ72344.1 membrane-bound acid phosphatase [Trypanosoma cruzi cruzi]PWU83384.1 putative membrane-bound acid phosphatase [Trypanosoma cruzi]
MTYQSMTTAWCVAILLLAVTGANGLYVLELVQVAHRHGVSPPPVATPNREKLCSPNGASSCTAIAKRGVEQMTAMGAHIRQLYSGDAATFGSATWFQPPYDVSAVSTRSIADPATLQAAAALLGGIYASENANIVPTIISTAPERDALLNVEAFPSSTITRMINAKAFNATLESVVDEQFPDASVVEAMGAEVGLDAALCSAPATRMVCCQRLQKLAVMYAAMGATDSAPTVMANKAKLDAVAAAYFHVSQGYNASVPQDVARGSLGLPLARELLRNMRAKMLPEGDANRNTKIMMQYAHRVPIQTALGHDPSDATPLGETFLVDLLRDDATNAYFVRLRYAAATNGAPAAAFFPFRCLSAADVPTDATTADGVICPFDDFTRFVESSSGTSAAGAACYLDEETRKKFGCSVEGAAPSPECARYRAMCPAQACPGGQVYDVRDDSCKPRVVLSDVISNGAGVAVGIAAVVLGFLLSLFLMHLCPMLCLTKGASEMHGECPDNVEVSTVPRQ